MRTITRADAPLVRMAHPTFFPCNAHAAVAGYKLLKRQHPSAIARLHHRRHH
ncbi:hypothetical protein ACFS07_27920 [Undibacterium arcticum]